MTFFCVSTIICALQLEFREDISDFLPQKSNYSKVSRFVETASGNSRIFIYFHQKDSIYNQKRIGMCMEKFVNIAKLNDTQHYFDKLVAKVDENQINKMSSFVQNNIALFIDSTDYQRAIDSCLTENHINSAFKTDKTILTAPVPGYIKNVVSTDPLGMFIHVLNDLKNFKPSNNYDVVDGQIFENDKKRGIIFYDSPTGMSESNTNAKIINILNNVSKELNTEFNDIEISLFGPPVIAVCNASQIKKDTILTSVFSIILILLILWFSIKNIQNLMIMGLTLLFGFGVALACAWLFFGEISLIALGISAVFTGIAVNYPLHFITHLYHAENMRENIKEIVSPLVIGNITTVSAFLALMFADSTALKDLGFVGGVLLASSILFTLIFVPHLAKKVNITENNSRFFKFNISFDFLQKKIVIIPILIITPILVYLGMKTEFDGNMSQLNYMTPELKKEANHTFGLLNADSAISVFIASTGKTIEQALENYEITKPITNNLLKQEKVLKISGIGNFIPSQKLQNEKINLWNNFINQNRDTILNIIENKSTEYKISKNNFKKFEKLLNDTLKTQEYSYFNEITNSGAGGYIVKDTTGWAVVTILRVKPENSEYVVNSLNNLNEDITVYDERIVSESLTNSLSDNFNYVLFTAGFIVFFFLTISFGSVELSLISFIPLTISWFWILGIMYLCDINFNIVNIILATFIFGQGDDYTVFITEGLIYEHSRGKKVLNSFKNSIALSSIIMFIGIGSLIFAQHPAMKSLGIVVIIGMFSVVAASYIFPPLLYNFLIKKDGKNRQVPLTIKALLTTLIYFIAFVIKCLLLSIVAFVVKHIGKNSIKSKIYFHSYLQKSAEFVKYIPRVKFKTENPNKETFEKPCVIICNHQSFLDPLCLMRLGKKIVFLTNERQQKNVFYGKVMKVADFYSVSDGYDCLTEKLTPLVKNGFSIAVFPEGTRSTDNQIHRFHQGAFYIAKHFKLDIVPVMIHGAGFVFAKNNLIMRPGNIQVTIGNRISQNSDLHATTILETSRNFRHYFIDKYNEISKCIENAEYYKNLVKANFLYKGSDIIYSINKDLNKNIEFIDKYTDTKPITINNCGYGASALLFAYVHKDIKVYATDPDEDKILVANNCENIPGNIEFSKIEPSEN
ncbi:MAG: 1-acyl-sn-glycerol-3-phosphate acyltransferase [Bacteroidales bacterium]|nr:1-acyl-sn-glycerol-3-phosphate acyltransferase [Bacteroidales bacterium]